MCVKGGLTLTGWHREELAEAQHTALTVWGPLFPYSNGVWRVWAQVCSGAPWGTEAVSSALEGPGGSLRRQDESAIAEVRHSTYRDDRWLKIVRGWTWNVFEEACRKPHHIRELFPVMMSCPLFAGICYYEEGGSDAVRGLQNIVPYTEILFVLFKHAEAFCDWICSFLSAFQTT